MHINDIKNSVCPKKKGGCWERILLISEYVKDYFVIQLDADTLTLGDIPEVHQWVSGKTSFALGTQSGQFIETMRELNERIKHQTKSEVPGGHFKFKITGHFSGFHIDLIEFFRRIMPADYYAKSTISSI